MSDAVSSPRDRAWWNQSGVSPWIPELIEVRESGASYLGTFQGTSPALPLLTELARERHGTQGGSYRAVVKLMDELVEQLPTEPTDLREAAPVVLGLTGPPSATTRRKSAAKKYDLELDTFRRPKPGSKERVLLERLAETLDRLAKTTIEKEEQVDLLDYVPRPEVEKLPADAVTAAAAIHQSGNAPQVASTDEAIQSPGWQRHNLVLVTAEPGSGASTLVSRHFAGRDMVRIDARDDVALIRTACAAFAEAGGPSVGHVGEAQHALARLLQGLAAPPVLVLDNVPDLDKVLDWLPKPLRSVVVIVTSGHVEDGLAPGVHIGALSPAAQVAFIQVRCDIDEALAERIGRLTGGRIGAITTVIALLEEIGISHAEAVVEMLRTDLISALEAGTRAGRGPVSDLHLRAIRQVRDHHPESLALLSTIAYGPRYSLTVKAVAALTADGGIAEATTPVEQIRFRARLRPLLALGLVRRSDSLLEMDPLVTRLCRAELAPTFRETANRVMDNAFDPQGYLYTARHLLELDWGPFDAGAFRAMPEAIMAISEPGWWLPGYEGDGLDRERDTEEDAERFSLVTQTRAQIDFIRVQNRARDENPEDIVPSSGTVERRLHRQALLERNVPVRGPASAP